MPDLLIAVSLGGYVSIVKLVILLIFFFIALPLIEWVSDDSDAIGADATFWTSIVFGTAAVSLIIWLLIPIFWVGLPLYIIAVASTALMYVSHRNTRVSQVEKVLTVEHLSSLLSKDKKSRSHSDQNMVFVTANKNEVPVPEPKTPEYYGYKIAVDIFKDIIYRRADNVILKPSAQNYSVTYFIDGTSVNQPTIDSEQSKLLVRFLKSVADLDIEERRKPQKGPFQISMGKKKIDWNITTAGSTAGEQVQIKNVSMQELKRIDDLGLSPEQLQMAESLRSVKQGVFLITGPAKSGTSSTLYAFLKSHDAYTNSIYTLEKKPVSNLDGITQTNFSLSDTGTTTYGRKLLSIFRTAPDIIGVAEAGDPEVMKITLQTVLENKMLVYCEFEAQSSAQAIAKWVKLTGDKNAAADTCAGVINQRLVRKLCDDCKQAYAPNPDLLRRFNLSTEKAKILYKSSGYQYDKRGKQFICETCQGTGFVGRIGIYEIIIFDDNIKNEIKSAKSVSDIESILRAAKMRPIQQMALRKVIEGTTAINEMLHAISSGEERKPAAPKKA